MDSPLRCREGMGRQYVGDGNCGDGERDGDGGSDVTGAY